MKKIIIIGHSASGYQSVEKIFQAVGMKQALPSKRDGMYPHEIDTILSKVVKTSKISEQPYPIKHNRSKRQVKKLAQRVELVSSHKQESKNALVNPLWDHLALDLMLGNLDQSFWGWANPEALDVLEYWQRVDPNIHFVFVYDSPNSVLLQYTEEQILSLDENQVRSELESWIDYNKKMLNTFEKVRDRAVLISSKQLIEFSENSIKTVYAQIQAPVKLDSNKTSQLSVITEKSALENKQLEYFFIDSMLKKHTDVLAAYEELQTYSDLPYLAKIDINKNAVLNIWKEIVKDKMLQQSKLKDSEALIQQYQNEAQSQRKENEKLAQKHKNERDAKQKIETENNSILSQLHLTQEMLEKEVVAKRNVEKKSADYQQKLSSIEKEKADLQSKLKDFSNIQSELKQVESENNSILSQLHLTQEMLEKEVVAKRNVEKKSADYQQKLSGIEKEKADLQSKLKDFSNIQSELKQVESENQTLLLQLHRTQEELEKQHNALMALKNPVYFGAAERFKNELPYRLGKKMIEASRSFKSWIIMPWLLISEAKKVKEEQNNLKLPNLEEYKDFSDIEKVKKHLSYRLGKILVDNIKSPIRSIFLPIKLVREIIVFKKQD
ncbi:Uncharacterised protein [Actinobacillus ureae]|uniref:hypothetical protein n=1 Tax=Actinobacillus ureae TaxID=723 RepID=UPI000E188EC9|nr:hypothetical protein [Actinobacillus ureae]SUT87922.1 Uncharacterised protein [Actinobacillus ureae]